MTKNEHGLLVPEDVGIRGIVQVKLWDEDGNLKHFEEVVNRITDVGDQYYAERAAGIGSPPNQVTGMRLGTDATAASKTGAGAAIVAYLTASQVAIAGGFPTSSQPGGAGTARRIIWQANWAAGVATASGATTIKEVVITNETPITNVAGTAANTIARAVLTAFNKEAGDTLQVTWNHDLLGGP